MEANLFWFMDIGPRETQEDCLMFDDVIKQVDHGKGQKTIESDPFVAAVCDGLGGHEAGEVASRYFCDSILMMRSDIDASRINEAFISMQKRSMDMIPSSCGTTMAGIRKMGNRVTVFNAGDTRVYHVSDRIRQVSHDHSYVQELIDTHLITERDAAIHPYKNIVTFGLGPVFRSNEANRNIFFNEIIVGKGDGILICSDGLYDSLSKASIDGALQECSMAGERLIGELMGHGLKDNCSFVFIWFE